MVRPALVLCLADVVLSLTARAAEDSQSDDGLRLAHQTLLSAIASGNPAMVEPILHRNALGFFRDGQMIAQLGEQLSAMEAIPEVLADLGRFSMSAHDAVYRAVGTTGVVCMATTLQPKKGEKTQRRYIRSTWVYASVDGAWRLVSWHTSDIPLKK